MINTIAISSLQKPVGTLEILVHLHRHDEVTITNLIKDAGLNQRTTYTALSKLESQDLIQQKQSDSFPVYKHYLLTKKGKKVAKQLDYISGLLAEE